MNIQNDNGLFIDTHSNTCIGYIVNFQGHRAYHPGGKVGKVTQDQIDTHNRLLAEAEWKGMMAHGKGVLYFVNNLVCDWPGIHKIIPDRVKAGRHNIAGKRVDVWFTIQGGKWHGVNIGDNDILRVKRLKAK